MAGPQSIGVITAAVRMEDLGVEIEAVGTAFANESVEITSKTSNIITAIRFTEGQFVRRNTILVELDTAQVGAELAIAEAALADSESQYNRSHDLFLTQALSRANLDQLEATLKSDRARVTAAKARLADNIIRAPFDGVTGFRRASLGSLVNPGTVITTLDDSSLIKLDFTVPQTHLYLLKKNLKIAATTSGLPNTAFEGRITTLDSRVDPITRSITVRAELPNKEGLLKPGMFMTVKLQGDVTEALLVPEEALVPEQGRVYVFVVQDGTAQRREIHIGRRRPGDVEVVTGLTEGDHVIIEGTQKVRDGVKVVAQLRGAAA